MFNNFNNDNVTVSMDSNPTYVVPGTIYQTDGAVIQQEPQNTSGGLSGGDLCAPIDTAPKPNNFLCRIPKTAKYKNSLCPFASKHISCDTDADNITDKMFNTWQDKNSGITKDQIRDCCTVYNIDYSPPAGTATTCTTIGTCMIERSKQMGLEPEVHGSGSVRVADDQHGTFFTD